MPAKPKPEGMESWNTADIPSTETEDEAWGHARRRTADTPMDSATPPTARRGQQLSSGADPPPEEGDVSLGSHRRRRLHALFYPSL